MGSVTCPVTLDYSLFVLSRFSEHHDERWPLQRNWVTYFGIFPKTVFTVEVLAVHLLC